MEQKTNIHTLLFQNNKEKALQHSYEVYDQTKESVQRDVNVLKEWLKTQPHLPEITSSNILENFLKINKFSIERTKRKIDMYYTIRQIIPELFVNKHPLLPHMQEIANVMYCVPLPKMTEEMYRVTVFKFKNTNVDKYVPNNFFAHTFNVAEIRLSEDTCLCDVLLYDCQGITMGHLLKLTPVQIKKVTTVIEEVFASRINQIHFINCPLSETLISMVKSVINPKLKKRIFVHKNIKSLFKYIPRCILPSDFGGDELSLDELTHLWQLKLSEYKFRFDELSEMKVKEELRPTPLVNDDILGFHGNFKKLDVD